MTIRFLAVVAAALIVQAPAVVAQGWRPATTTGGFSRQQQLYVKSNERNARLTAACSEYAGHKGMVLDIDMNNDLGIFDFLGGDYFVPLRVRFLPDTTIDQTNWISRASDGQFHTASAEYPDSLLAHLTKTDVFQVELRIYGGGRPTATFKIPNRDLLGRFVAECH